MGEPADARIERSKVSVIDISNEVRFMRYLLERDGGWDSFAESCNHRVDECSPPVCNYHESAPGDCCRELCPLWDRLRRGVEYDYR